MSSEEYNPYQTPQASLNEDGTYYDASMDLPTPVPFEDIEKLPSLWDRITRMFSLAFKNPMELFMRIPVTQGFGAPWRFMLILAIPQVLLGAGVLLLILALGFSGAGNPLKNLHISYTIAVPIVLGILILIPLFIFLGMIIVGAINHCCLWLWGGTKAGVGIEQTIRAEGYASGIINTLQLPLQLLGMIPILGMIFQLAQIALLITALVFKGMGLAKMHQTDTWRGVVAVLTPLVVCCCICIVVIIAMVAFYSRR